LKNVLKKVARISTFKPWLEHDLMITSDATDTEIVAFLADVARQRPRDARLAADLARVLADSGRKLARRTALAADVASTGGPTSLSTLLCPLFLRAGGLEVPKLGVPGRPAGGIDCLAQIAGYKTSLTDQELAAVLQAAGYAHFLAAGRYAPLDAKVFKLRQLHGLQQVPTLVAASLLSKKLAVGVSIAGLDVRVAGHGNFGRSMEEARANADMYVKASAMYQPYIGRSEALAALDEIFSGSASLWLLEHVELCRRLAIAATPAHLEKAVNKATPDILYREFRQNVIAQGAEEDDYRAVVRKVRQAIRHPVVAKHDGPVSISLERIRQALTKAQRCTDEASHEFPDPAGIVLCVRPGDVVTKGTILALVRVDADTMRESLLQAIGEAVCTTRET
jgi:pyrimidine-nucleoside phosphorylase